MKRFFCFLIAFLCFSTVASANIFDARSFTLKNGLQVVVIENHRAPIVTQMLWYKAGSIDDPLGKSGTAHLLEHLMFKGTKTVPNGEFSQIIARNGGQENAFTSADMTVYYQNIARDRLELILFLESDRMKNLSFSEKDFLPEQEVVKEERLMRYDNNPAALLSERKNMLLWGDHPYGRPVIGFKKELNGLTLKDALAFYKSNYAPDKAVLVIAGDVTVDEIKPLVEKYYGGIAASRDPLTKRPFVDPQPVSGKIEMRHHQVKVHSLARDCIVPSLLSEGKEQAFALTVLNEIMTAYHSGKMYRRFINEKKTARSAGTSYGAFARDKTTFSFYIGALKDGTLPEIESDLNAFFADLTFSKKELENAKTRLVADLDYLNDDPAQAAGIVGRFYALGLTIDDLKSWKENIEKVSLADVRKAYETVKTASCVTTYLMPEENKK